jgi:methionyl-tRNA formyltransferase
MMTGVDNGPIVARSKVDITENDTAETLYNKVTSAGGELFKETLPSFADNTFTLTPQNESEATYHPRGEPYGGQINPHWSDNTKITKRSLG